MPRGLLPTILLSLFLTITSAFSIVPMEAGSLVVEDAFLRHNTCIFKNADLHLTKEEYEKQPKIRAVAALSDLSMDNHLSFQIFYKIGCPYHKCQLQFTIERITPEVNPLFSYQLTIDYLIAQGLDLLEVNMTSNRQLVKFPIADEQLIKNDENIEKKEEEQKMVAIAIPNGFNDLSLTGGVEIIKLEQKDLYLLKYMRPYKSSSTEWTLSQNFILYQIIFLPASDMAALQQNKDHPTFAGLKSTLRQSLTTLLPSKQTQLFQIPLSSNEQFVDERSKAMTQLSLSQVETTTSSNYMIRIILGVIFLGILEFGYLVYRHRLKWQRRQAGYRDNLQMPDMIISFNEPIVREEVVKEVPTQSQTQIQRNTIDV